MRRIKTDVAIIGSGATAVLIANSLLAKSLSVVLVNPFKEFNCDDIRPHHGLSLWNAAYRAAKDANLSEYQAELESRMREIFPAPLESSELRKIEQWTVLSSTPIHGAQTKEFEKEFFRIEKKPWASGQVRLLGPDHVAAWMRKQGLELQRVARIEGGLVRNYALWWSAPRILLYLLQFLRSRFAHGPRARSAKDFSGALAFSGVRLRGRYGRKIVIEGGDLEEVSIEPEARLLISLSGDILPTLRSVVASCDEPWVQGVRKRRREQHFAWFNSPVTRPDPSAIWIELGGTKYLHSPAGMYATWSALRGPDALDGVIDEGFRVLDFNLDAKRSRPRFVRCERAFRLEWDWKNPQWRRTAHDTFWATAFEGDLWSALELAWNVPLS